MQSLQKTTVVRACHFSDESRGLGAASGASKSRNRRCLHGLCVLTQSQVALLTPGFHKRTADRYILSHSGLWRPQSWCNQHAHVFLYIKISPKSPNVMSITLTDYWNHFRGFHSPNRQSITFLSFPLSPHAKLFEPGLLLHHTSFFIYLS